ncbi:MAG: sulfite exporter TauE/SafE family protein [Alphaproteobacteria bacterium]|nr:sulfite exporter TauE/SafE family protein [Alphaproteobacteria bacterium]
MGAFEFLILLGTGMVSGGLNAIVGGGSFLSFPVLIFLGIPPIEANATSTVALWPGTCASLWAFRKELFNQTRLMKFVIPLSFIGGGIGALILISLSNEHFANIVPMMLILATCLFSFRDPIIRTFRRIPKEDASQPTAPTFFYWLMVIATQLMISTYGGFFGAGMGILFMAFFSIIGIQNMHEINAIRNGSAACINSIATVIFCMAHKVMWMQMVVMGTGAIVGGFLIAHYSRGIPSNLVRLGVIVASWSITGYFLWKEWLQ